MLASLGGALALVLGLAVLLLPLLLPELSRSRDAVWGAVVLLLGLVLVTSAERLTGAPMLGVLCGALLIGRLGVEVSQGRWRQLTEEERQRLCSAERWQRALGELGGTTARLLEMANQLAQRAGTWLGARGRPRSGGKRWVRPEPISPGPASPESPAPADAGSAPEPRASSDPPTDLPDSVDASAADPVVVQSFKEIDALIQASDEAADDGPDAPADASEPSNRAG
ncbi:MAG: Ycf66 family protein [Prochlorococcaceae cyanobacterium]